MIKKLVTMASFTLGGAGMILVGYLQADPLAFTRPAPTSNLVEPPPAATHAIQEAAPILTIPEVTIVASARVDAAPARVASLEPCSAWSEVGAMFIAPGGATGVHAVRNLCP